MFTEGKAVMKHLFVPFAFLSLVSAPALAAPPHAVGTPVLDTKGNPVGIISATEGDAIVRVRTDRHEIRLPVGSFTAQDGKLYLALTQAELNAKYEADMAAVADSLEVGKPVKGLNGALLGTIEAIDDKEVLLKLTSGQSVKLPRNGIAGAVDGATAGITLDQLQAQLQASESSN
jgi:preprotein translocase subunit YajC